MSKYFKDKNFLAGIIFLIFDLFYLIYGLTTIPISDHTGKGVGAGFMPLVYGICSLIFALILLIQSTLRIRKENMEGTEKKLVNSKIDSRDAVRVVSVFILVILYTAFLQSVGFIICSIPLLYFLVILLTPNAVKDEFLKKHYGDSKGNIDPNIYNGAGKLIKTKIPKYYLQILLFAVTVTIFIDILFGRALGLKMPAGILKNVLPF